jgi:hypothetical protein
LRCFAIVVIAATTPIIAANVLRMDVSLSGVAAGSWADNPNVPAIELKPAIGTGVEIVGGAYDTVRANFIADQGSWGVVTQDYPDLEKHRPAHTARAASSCRRACACSPATGT